MSVFLDRDVRHLFVAAGLFALTLVLAAQVVVHLVAADVTAALVARDAGRAGVLMARGMDATSAAAVFTAPVTAEQREAGRLALTRVGVSAGMDASLLPEAASLADRYRPVVVAASLSLSLVCIGGLYLYFARQERRVEQATRSIERFMQAQERGGAHVAFDLAGDSLAEGSMARLLGAISGMAASLTAHLQSEQQGRDFLKDTISDISHQLRTPLAALRMFTEIIRDEAPTEPVIAGFSLKSEREVSHMEYLVESLLKLARLDAGAISLERSSFPLPAFLDGLLATFSVRAEAEGKRVQVLCPAGAVLVGDRHWLAEAIGNLVKNAFDHTTKGGLVRVTCEETPLLVTIAVQDDGAGIHPDDLPHVFKRFYRSRFSQDREGVGIGLTLVRGIVDLHGGAVVAESEPGRGATFRVTLPKLTDL